MLDRAGLKVAEPLATFVEERLLPPLGIYADAWWQGVAGIFARFAPENIALLQRRADLQAAIDARYEAGEPVDPAFLREIGYLVPEPARFTIGTTNVDAEIATMAGPQLVVPSLNARFVLNAANARWGSLYDAFYGTDALPGAATPGGYDTVRGAAVVAAAKAFLDEVVPLANGTWADFAGGEPVLRDPAQAGRTGGAQPVVRAPWAAYRTGRRSDASVGATDPAHIADVLLESALTTIVDLEDSVAAVDAEDKVAAYANWLGLMDGTLTETFEKVDGR